MQQEQVVEHTEATASELLSEAQAGNRSAFERLVERHRDDVYSVGLQMTRSETSALNIAQRSFLSACLQVNDFRTEAEFGAWVRQMAAELTVFFQPPQGPQRTIKDEVKSRALNKRGAQAEDRLTDCRYGGGEERLDAELQHVIQRAADQLPQDQRAVLVFRDLAALTYEQIAQVNGLSIAAIKHRLHQARLSLREAIDGFCRNDRLADTKCSDPPELQINDLVNAPSCAEPNDRV